MNPLEQRILKGITYFESVPPSKINTGHIVHLKVLLGLMRQYLEEQQTKTYTQEAFNLPA